MAFPLVQLAGPYAHCVLPIPYRKRLLVTSTAPSPKIWLAGRRLPAAPKITYSTASDSPYMNSLAEAYGQLTRAVDRIADYSNATSVGVDRQCPVEKRVTLAEVEGPAELVGFRLRFQPGALDLLRYQVIEITVDGTASVRMPLVDFLGVSHPWPHAWFPMAGGHVAGIVHPVYHGRGWREPAIVAYCKLPVPFRDRLSIAVRNRSSLLPVTVEGELAVVPLEEAGDGTALLCGTSRRIDLRRAGPQDVLRLPASGRLVGLSLFTTGHGPDPEWRRESFVQLVDAGGVLTEGAGLLPLALQGISSNITFESVTWNHNSFEPTGRCGAARYFWVDPLPFREDARLRYVARGKDGPARAEAGMVWYQASDAPPYAAPEVPDDVETLPPVLHRQPGKPSPGGWSFEAERLASVAGASCGRARAETVGAKDAFASADAFLAWNAERPGDALDLVVPMPESPYVRLWYHRLLSCAGGVFRIELAGADEPFGRPPLARNEDEFTARVLGQARARASIDCYDFWPHRQAYRFEMPIMLNPAPGRRGRIRFTAMTKQRESRGYLLAVDQIGLDPAPPTPDGWHEIESSPVVDESAVVAAERMPYGRPDFHGWGGLQVRAEAPGSITLSLFQATGPPPEGIQLRGVVESGAWRAQIGNGAADAVLDGQEKNEPILWTLPLTSTPEGNNALELKIRAESREGRLLLDAWRHAPEVK